MNKERLFRSKVFWALVAWGLILLVSFLLNPDFFSIHFQTETGALYGSLIDIINRATEIIIIAFGMTLVIATGGTDLSVGAVVALSGAVSVALIRGDTIVADNASAMPFIVIIIVPLIVSAICGLWNGLLVSRMGIQPIIATLILMVAGRGIAQLITGARLLTTGYPPFLAIGRSYLLGLPLPVFLWIGVFVVIWFITKRTALGMFIESVGINPSASRYSGLNSKNVILLTYVISGICAGIAGLIYASRIGVADANNAGLYYELDAILAVVIGGTSMSGGKFSLAGSLVGALIIRTIITTVYYFGIAAEATMVFRASIVVVVIILQSEPVRAWMSRRKHEKVVSDKGGAAA